MAFFTGLLLGFSLILSIGAQNIFLLKRAIRREHAFTVAFVCFICDVILILLSVLSTTTMAEYLPVFKPLMLFIAMLFLLYYGFLSLKSSFQPHESFDAQSPSSKQVSLFKLILLTMSFSLLNPQAILELVVLLGGVASNYHEGYQEIEFMLGASLASFIWFLSITLLGMYLSKFITKASVWCWVERLSALLMFVIATNCGIMLLKSLSHSMA